MYGCHSIRECYNLFSGVKLSPKIVLFYFSTRRTQFFHRFFPPFLNYHVPPIFTRYHFTGEKIIELLREWSLIMPEGGGGGLEGKFKYSPKIFIAHVRFQFFFHSTSRKLYLVSWPSSAAYTFLDTLKAMNCQVTAISKTTAVTHLLY